MSVAIIGRTRWLLDAARKLADAGLPIGLVVTAEAESFYACGADEFESFAREIGAAHAFGPSLNC